jgi:3-O-methylgallate 3,4-dioxygenase
MRKDKSFGAQAIPETRRERFARCQTQLDRLSDLVLGAHPEIIVIVGDDQHEWFTETVQPPFAIFSGDHVTNFAMSEREIASHRSDGRLIDPLGYHPASEVCYPVAAPLAKHIVRSTLQDGFDVAVSMKQPAVNLGHAYGFIYRRILRDHPIPFVPVLVNTFYEPNQPTARRCLDFGRAIGRAIRSWPSSTRIAVCGSGGLSHFVIDEEFDHVVLTALANNDLETLANQSDDMFQSGTSEIKNWLIAAGALAETGLRMTLLDYVPCYRTEGGTGNAMGFAVWQ